MIHLNLLVGVRWFTESGLGVNCGQFVGIFKETLIGTTTRNGVLIKIANWHIEQPHCLSRQSFMTRGLNYFIKDAPVN